MTRRIIDIVVALLALLLMAPLALPVALLVAIESPGNPLYAAWRCGLGGRRFRMWKFRSMVRNASALGPSITGGNDPRITRVGRYLRASKIDELPQFINVLTGDMTLVGPRPESPDIVERYTDSHRRVLDVKPGITGPVQLASGEESESIPPGVAADEHYVAHLMESKLRRDLEYLERRTASSDARVVLSTFAYVARALRQRG